MLICKRLRHGVQVTASSCEVEDDGALWESFFQKRQIGCIPAVKDRCGRRVPSGGNRLLLCPDVYADDGGAQCVKSFAQRVSDQSRSASHKDACALKGAALRW
jgi:hypothetical protein